MRYTQLDGLRGLAALSVYFSHLIGVFTINSTFFQNISNSPLHMFWHGESAVTLFFLLSGFVLTLPSLKKEDDLDIPIFYIKRIFRIYPAFIFAILFSLVIKEILFNPQQMGGYSNWINEFWKWDIREISFVEFFNTLFLSGLPFDTKLIDPVVGTLRTEMLVSLILPFLIFIALRTKFLLNIVILTFFFVIGKDVLAVFYLGIIMAIYKTKIFNNIDSENKKYWIFLILIVASIFYTSRYSLQFLFMNHNKFSQLISILGCVLFLILAIKSRFFAFFLNKKYIQFLGKISYSMYLIHFPILLLVCSLGSFNIFYLFLITIILTVFISKLMFEFIEIPLIRIGKNINVSKLNNESNIVFALVFSFLNSKFNSFKKVLSKQNK